MRSPNTPMKKKIKQTNVRILKAEYAKDILVQSKGDMREEVRVKVVTQFNVNKIIFWAINVQATAAQLSLSSSQISQSLYSKQNENQKYLICNNKVTECWEIGCRVRASRAGYSDQYLMTHTCSPVHIKTLLKLPFCLLLTLI